MKEEMRACSVCGKLHPESALTEFDDTLLCGAGLQTETIRCQRCGERVWADDNAGDDDTPLSPGATPATAAAGTVSTSTKKY